MDFPLSAAPGFAAALDSGDPVVAASTASEVPAEIPEKFGHPAGERVWMFPVKAGKEPAAVLYCWGDVAVPVIELYSQVASGAWAALHSAETPAPAAASASSDFVSDRSGSRKHSDAGTGRAASGRCDAAGHGGPTG